MAEPLKRKEKSFFGDSYKAVINMTIIDDIKHGSENGIELYIVHMHTRTYFQFT